MLKTRNNTGISRPYRQIPFVLTLLLMFMAVMFSNSHATVLPSMTDGQIKAAFVSNVIRYVTWPANATAADNEICIGVLGRSTPGNAWQSLNGRAVNGKKLRLRISTDIQDLDNCQVVFIDTSERKSTVRAISHLGNDPVLTIGDSEGFISHDGGMIKVVSGGGRLSFSISLRRARNAGLTISSHLLKLATEVYQ